MVKKLEKKKSVPAASGAVKGSAKQIWQAGLGALTRAQAEGTKAVESLVKESMSIQRKTAAAAESNVKLSGRGVGMAWITALTGDNPQLKLPRGDADELFRAWQAWAGEGDAAGN